MTQHALAPMVICVIACCATCKHMTGDDCISYDRQIDATEASTLALLRFEQLFSDKYILNTVDQRHYRMPALTKSQVTSVEAVGPVWLVRVEPPAGLSMEARVAKDGSWTELVRVRWSPQ